VIKRLALAHVALLVAWPAVAQVTTIPVGSLTQTSMPGGTLTLAISLRGNTGLLPNQTVNVAPIALLQPQVSAEFPVTNTSLTVTELVVRSTIQTSTSQSSAETRAKLPSSITVPAAQRLKVVYSVPAGQQPQLQFSVGAPTTPTGGASPSGTRITQVGQSFTDSAGNKWSLAAPNPAVEGGLQPVVLRNGVVFGSALELVWQNMLIYARNTGNVWYSIGPLETSIYAWRSTSAPA
jgi:hypothetical protein